MGEGGRMGWGKETNFKGKGSNGTRGFDLRGQQACYLKNTAHKWILHAFCTIIMSVFDGGFFFFLKALF